MNAPAQPGHNQSIGERCHDAMVEAAKKTSEALRLDKLRKRMRAQCVIQSGAGSVAKAEYEARMHQDYTTAETNYVEAQTQANMAKAHADGLRIVFEEWRTLQATTRAEMNLR